MPTEAQLNKLPKWAQSAIAVAEKDRDYYKDIVKKVEAHDTNTRIQDYIEGDRHLPEGSTVIFSGSSGDIRVEVTKYGSRSVVTVSTEGIGQSIRMAPVASNMIEVHVHDRV